jgi:hypothetical protein
MIRNTSKAICQVGIHSVYKPIAHLHGFGVKISNIMRSGQTMKSPLFRFLSAGTLIIFIAAEVMCFVHCHFGGGRSDSPEPTCHHAAAEQSNHDEDAPTQSPSGMSPCSTLQNLFASNSTLTLSVPDFPALYVLAPLAPSLDTTAIEASAPNSRPAQMRKWAVTPEVYLGPAIHSLAPPLLS